MLSKDSAKTILCYGDSNTRGSVPKLADSPSEKHPRSVRWTGVLQNLIGDDFEIINEGLSGRTLVAFNSEYPERTGITHLKAILLTHRPIDLVIVMLGTNDVKDIYNLSAEQISEHLEQTIKLIQEQGVQKTLVVCPAKVIAREDGTVDARFSKAPEKMEKLPLLFKEVAEKYNCNFLNLQEHITSSKIDGFHLEPEMHRKIGELLAKEISKIL